MPDRKIQSRELILEIKNLSVYFKKKRETIPAVKNISMNIHRNEIVGIVGASGSGKSISMLATLGLEPAHAYRKVEQIRWHDQNIHELSKKELRRLRGKAFAYVYQEPSQAYDPLCSIYKTFLEAYKAHCPSITQNAAREHTISLLKKVGIDQAEKRLKNYFHQFSGGMVQRVQIALSLAHSPELLIADEVSTALDLHTQKKIVELLLRLCREQSMSMVFISHDLALVSNIADRLLVMYEGEIVESGSARSILQRPQHDYTRLLLSSTIHFGDRYQGTKK